MDALKKASFRYPITLFLLISFTFTWSVWFSSLFFQDNWAMRKIITSMGFGPAIAAILLSTLRDKKCIVNSGLWWCWFCASFCVLLASYLSVLATGDGIVASEFHLARPLSFSTINISLCLIAAAVGAFVIAATFGATTPIYQGFISLKKSGKWLMIAALLPSLWFLAGLFLATIQGKEINDVTGGLEKFTWIFYVVRSAIFTLMVVAVGEELGWRGWLLPTLQEKFSPLTSSVFLGIVWGLWHFPLYMTGAYDEPPHRVFAKVGVCIFLSILFTFLHNRSHGNVLVAILLHTALNNTQRLIPVTESMGIFMLLTILTLPFLDKMWRPLQVTNRLPDK